MIFTLFITLWSTHKYICDGFHTSDLYRHRNSHVKSVKFRMIPEIATALIFSLNQFGNIPESLNAMKEDINSITCTLDPQQSDTSHDSCQLIPKVVRIRAGKVLTFNQDWGSSSSTGSAIWNGANVASKYFETKLSNQFKNTRVIELGAGVGFEGIIAHHLGAKEVAITDGSEEVLKLAHKNIEVNCELSNNKKVYVGQLRWNTPDETLFQSSEPWDYILASDVTYLKKNRHDLMAAISHLSSSQTVTYLSMEPRSIDEVEDTLSEANKFGLIYEEIVGLIDAKKSGCNLQCARLFALRQNPADVKGH